MHFPLRFFLHRLHPTRTIPRVEQSKITYRGKDKQLMLNDALYNQLIAIPDAKNIYTLPVQDHGKGG